MINKVILVGNVGMDPEVRTLESGVKTARVRLATSERFYNRETQQATEHTEWHTITLWRNLADVVDRFVKKGSQIYVEGRLRTREWTDQTGNKRYSTEIMADDMKLLGRREGGAAQSEPSAPQNYGAAQTYTPAPQPAAAPAAPAIQPTMEDSLDDLPF
ncbi:MAG: single-stranded DNA-binding protein [Tidjanibacter sp.]|jgi:single-strand DNA-binding protein|nr:single-stranded DNA-binding protein [Tidjanibacter sp.]